MHDRRTLAALALTLTLAACHSPPAAEISAAQPTVAGTVHLCSSCHGITGRSISPTFPNLAGQQQDYLEAQLHAFRDHSRADPHAHTYMWGMAAHLDDQTITGIAAYFAGQPAAAGEPATPALMPLGLKIFNQGIDERSVPACSACHGEHAEGQGAIPRLAGQHIEYLTEQLHHFRSNARANEAMHQNAENLTDPEIEAIADYLHSL